MKTTEDRKEIDENRFVMPKTPGRKRRMTADEKYLLQQEQQCA